VKSTKRKFQVGSQGCSDQKWHTAGKYVKEGKIGNVVVAQGSYMRNGRVGEWNNYGDNPYKAPHNQAGPGKSGDDFIDWETFRRGKLTKEFNPDVFFRWRKYFAVGSGLVGDLFPHRLHPLFIAMAQPWDDPMKGWPVRVSSGGGLYVQKINPDNGKPDRDVPDFTNINVDFENCTLMAMSSTINEQGWPDCVRGNKATIYFGGTSVEIKPERVWADEVEGQPAEQVGNGEHIETHEANWLDCIRDGKEPNANIDIAARVQVMITLGELAYRNNETFTFDPKTRKATPDTAKFPPA
jgi:predicted dehydrogenase